MKIISRQTFKERNIHRYEHDLIRLKGVSKAYETETGEFLALKSVNLEVSDGEFVGVVGKSGSGKSTLINMMSGIDRPTKGEIYISGSPIHTFNENNMAKWRGKNLGIVFQFFQLLPILTVIENVMLPMDFCNVYTRRERKERALYLLEEMEMADHAGKLPSQLSGGEQHRVAIARAMANDPPIILADEPTGNLDSKTAEIIFHLFGDLVEERKTIVMVTHDNDLAQRVKRTIMIVDGEIIEEYLLQTFTSLTQQQLVWTSARLRKDRQPAGTVMIHQGGQTKRFYIVVRGYVEMTVSAGGKESVVCRVGEGQYFGELGLVNGGVSPVSIRVPDEADTEMVYLEADDFQKLINDSQPTRQEIESVINKRNQMISGEMGHEKINA